MIKRCLAVAATALTLTAGFSGPVQALALIGSSSPGGNGFADYSAAGLLSFDVDFNRRGTVSAEYRIEADDLRAPLDFEAIVRNLTGLGLEGLELQLSAGRFASAGSVTRPFGGTGTVTGVGSATALLAFDPPEYLDIELGDVFGSPGHRDWTIALDGLRVGDRLAISVSAVPEPGTLALVAGVLSLGLLRRRRR